MTFDEYIMQIASQGDLKLAEDLLALQTLFPDVELYHTICNTTVYVSSKVNDLVDHIDIHCNYGCPGAPLVISPWAHMGLKIFSSPCEIVIGHHNQNGFGQIPLDGWKEKLSDLGLSKIVINKVKDFLDRHRPICYDEVL